MAKPLKLTGFQKAALDRAAEKDAADPQFGPTGRVNFVLDSMQTKHNAGDGTCGCANCR